MLYLSELNYMSEEKFAPEIYWNFGNGKVGQNFTPPGYDKPEGVIIKVVGDKESKEKELEVCASRLYNPNPNICQYCYKTECVFKRTSWIGQGEGDKKALNWTGF